MRKSSRAHAAIDYVGLNEGVVKTSKQSPNHPYVELLKQRSAKFLPDHFARLPPEVVTLDFFDKGDGMKEPVVIPASLNPQRNFAAEEADGRTALASEQFDLEPDFQRLKDMVKSWLSEDQYRDGPDHGQDKLDMVMPQNLTVRRVAELYGPLEKVEVIDVKSQGEAGSWNLRRWADYYESKKKSVVRNVISLEVSHSKLGRLIKRPKVVRQLDLVNSVWPPELKDKGDYPKVQLYCLMSVADSYTDFHIDFGGSSVFYHILKGKKTFLFIPPKGKNLKKYEQWCLSPTQNQTFLPDETNECHRVDLSAGDTMLIPSGWIHAVWTPEDSLVIGGNFLTRLHLNVQFQVSEIEKTTKVPRKFRHPHFQRIMWFTAIRYLQDDPLPTVVEQLLCEGKEFARAVPAHLEFDAHGDRSKPGPQNHQSRYYSKYELDGLPFLILYLLRTVLISLDKITDGITADTRLKVTRAIPKGYGEPFKIVKRLSMWVAWKRGNTVIPDWAYPDADPDIAAPTVTEKKPSAAMLKKMERQAAREVAPPRRSERGKGKEISSKQEQTIGTAGGDVRDDAVPTAPGYIEGSVTVQEGLPSIDVLVTATAIDHVDGRVRSQPLVVLDRLRANITRPTTTTDHSTSRSEEIKVDSPPKGKIMLEVQIPVPSFPTTKQDSTRPSKETTVPVEVYVPSVASDAPSSNDVRRDEAFEAQERGEASKELENSLVQAVHGDAVEVEVPSATSKAPTVVAVPTRASSRTPHVGIYHETDDVSGTDLSHATAGVPADEKKTCDITTEAEVMETPNRGAVPQELEVEIDIIEDRLTGDNDPTHPTTPQEDDMSPWPQRVKATPTIEMDPSHSKSSSALSSPLSDIDMSFSSTPPDGTFVSSRSPGPEVLLHPKTLRVPSTTTTTTTTTTAQRRRSARVKEAIERVAPVGFHTSDGGRPSKRPKNHQETTTSFTSRTTVAPASTMDERPTTTGTTKKSKPIVRQGTRKSQRLVDILPSASIKTTRAMPSSLSSPSPTGPTTTGTAKLALNSPVKREVDSRVGHGNTIDHGRVAKRRKTHTDNATGGGTGVAQGHAGVGRDDDDGESEEERGMTTKGSQFRKGRSRKQKKHRKMGADGAVTGGNQGNEHGIGGGGDGRGGDDDDDDDDDDEERTLRLVKELAFGLRHRPRR